MEHTASEHSGQLFVSTQTEQTQMQNLLYFIFVSSHITREGEELIEMIIVIVDPSVSLVL